MPGGLAAWLDDDHHQEHANHVKNEPKSNKNKNKLEDKKNDNCSTQASRPHVGQEATTVSHTPSGAQGNTRRKEKIYTGINVDEAAVSSPMTGAGENEANCGRVVEAKEQAGLSPWDPFAIRRHNAAAGGDKNAEVSNDAFTRLLQKASSSKQLTTPAHTAQKSATSVSPPAAVWNPFASTCTSGDGKENRQGNALSKLVGSAPRTSAKGGRNLMFKGMESASAGGKRKRPSEGFGVSGGASAVSEADMAGATTRFCECPVCGKRVIIELCSSHLDSECSGARTERPTTPSPTPPPQPSNTTADGHEAFTTPTASSLPDTSSFALKPCEGTEAKGIKEAGSPGRRTATTGADDCDGGGGAVEHGDSAVNTLAVENEQSLGEDRALRETRPLVSTLSPPVRFLQKNANHSPVPALQPRRSSPRGAGVVVSAIASSAMTKCPVCGFKVRADLCSNHLDTQCSGFSTNSTDDDKVEGEGQTREGRTGLIREHADRQHASAASACTSSPPNGRADDEGRKGEDVGRAGRVDNEAAGGMTALAAELTCPVCLCLFDDPQGLPCSHRFCLACITDCFKSSKRQECPLCKVPAWKRDLKRDVPLRNIVQAYRRMAA